MTTQYEKVDASHSTFIDVGGDHNTYNMAASATGGSAIGIMASGSSKVDLVSGNTFTVIARGENSRARGLVVHGESQIKMGTDNRFHVEEA